MLSIKYSLIFLITLMLIGSPFAEDSGSKKVTLISAVSSADGKSSMGTRLLEECIEKIPEGKLLSANVTAKPLFLKEINGEKNKNEFVTVYTATLDVNYMVHQKELIIITSNSVEKSEPLMGNRFAGRFQCLPGPQVFVRHQGQGQLVGHRQVDTGQHQQ